MASLLDSLDRPLFVTDRSGQFLFANLHAHDSLNEPRAAVPKPTLNLFSDILHVDRKGFVAQLENGEQEVTVPLDGAEGKSALAFAGCRNPTGWLFTSSRLPLKLPPTKRKCARPCRS